MQSLDVTLFQSLKHFHKQVLQNSIHSRCYDFNKMEFLAAIGKIWQQAFKRISIIHAWRDCGLFPYNPEIVLQKFCEKEPDQAPVIPSYPTTPRTPQSLWKAVADFMRSSGLFDDAEALDKYMLFLKGADFQAVSGAQAKEDLKHTQAAEKARQARSKWKNTRVQKEGVLRAADWAAIQYQKEVDKLTAAKEAYEKAQKHLQQKKAKVEK